jgi:hypothetical protein
VVTVLMHRDCPVNGEVIESRGGEIRRLFMAICPGVVLDDDAMTPEMVATEMDRILDPVVPITVGPLVDLRTRP